MLTRDFVGGVSAIIIGSVYLYHSTHLGSSLLADSIGPAGIPLMLGSLMITLGVVLCLQSIYHQYKSNQDLKPEWQGQRKRIFRASGMLLLGIAYLLVVQSLGYLLSIALLILLVALYQGADASWRVFVIAGGGAITLWAFFVLLLNVSMPSGIF
jgi:hypothetical protein